MDPVHIVPLDAPVSLCKHLTVPLFAFITQRDSVPSNEASMPDVFVRLMESFRRLVLPEAIATPDGGRAQTVL